MKISCQPTILSIILMGFSYNGFAAEFGGVPSMQRGPLGQGLGYAELDEYAAEGAFGMRRTYGKEVLGADSDSRVSQSLVGTRLAAAGGMNFSKEFLVAGFLDMTINDYDEERTRKDPEVKLDGGLATYELGANFAWRGSPLIAGGGLGLLLVGSEDRTFEYGDDTYKTDASSAAMPVMRLFGGVDLGEFTTTLAVRFFTRGESSVEALDPGENKYIYDMQRKNPGEVAWDGRFKFSKEAAVGWHLAYVLTGQASDPLDPYSISYSGAAGDSSRVRQTSSVLRNKNHVELGVAGRFQPSDMFGLLGGIYYKQAAYAESSYASLEAENLGGMQVNMGADAKIDQIRGFLQAGYALENSASYTLSDTTRSQAKLNQTQKSPVEKGTTVKVSQGSWNVLGGASYKF